MILKKRYDEIMDKIQVTDEMHNRILDHIQKSDLQKTKPFKITWSHTVKKYGSIAACLVILAASAVVLPSLWEATGKSGHLRRIRHSNCILSSISCDSRGV